jgi:hypothetical protein
VACAPLTCFAQAQADQAAEKQGFFIKPSVIQATDGEGATLALDYTLDLTSRRELGSDKGSPTLETSTGAIELKLTGKGTIAADKAKNPRNFLDLLGSASYAYGTAFAGDFAAGAFLKYEADQALENRQAVYGGRLTYANIDFLGASSFFIDLDYGQVDPEKDEQRIAVAGDEGKKKYSRWAGEIYYSLPLGWHLFRKLELNYRYFRETSAPNAIRLAGLDRHVLRIARLGMKDGFFIAYSSGRLPFDRKDDKAVQAGWSYKLK